MTMMDNKTVNDVAAALIMAGEVIPCPNDPDVNQFALSAVMRQDLQFKFALDSAEADLRAIYSFDLKEESPGV